MVKVNRNIFIVYVDTDWKVTNTIPAPIAGGGNGQTTIRIVSAEANPTEYTGILTFILTTGQEYTRDPVPILEPNGVEEVNGEDWYVWDYPLNNFITSNSSKNADGTLYFNSIFTNILDTDNVNPQIPQSSATISASTQKGDVVLPPDDVTNLTGMIQQKRNINSTPLSDIDNDNVNLMTFYDSTAGAEKKQTKTDFIQDVADELGDTTGVIAYPTDGLAGITSPLTGNPVTRTVDDINDGDFDKENATEISHVIQATGVWETAFESVYPIGFLTGEYTSLVFTQNVFAKKLGANIDLRTSYYIYDAINGLRIIGSGPSTFMGAVITVNTDTYSANSKQNVINELAVDPGIGERVYTVTEVRGTAGDTGFAQIEDGVSTFSTWQLPTGGALAGLIRKVPSPVEDNIASQTADGSLKDGGIAIGDVMQKSIELPTLELIANKGIAGGYAGVELDGFISNSILPQSLKRWLGTFGTAGSDTGGDLPTVAVSVGDTYECIIDAYNSVIAGKIFDNGDFATYNGTGWSKTDNTEAVKSVNGKTGIITIVSTDIPDMPSTLVGQAGKQLQVNVGETTYEHIIPNVNTSTAVIDGMILSKGTGNTINISAGTYAVVDYTDPVFPKVTRVTYAGGTDLAISTIATGYTTHIAIDVNMVVTNRNAHLTGEQRRVEVFLGIVEHFDKVNINTVQATPVVNNQPVNTTFDMNPKPFIEAGIVFSGVSGATSIEHTAGNIVGTGINASVSLASPHVRLLPAESPETFREIFRDGAGDININTGVTVFDPNRYDDGSGTLSTIGNPENVANHYIYIGTDDQVTIIIGQNVYDTIANANLAYLNQTDTVSGIPDAVLEHSILRSIMSVDKSATDFSNSAEALFYTPVVSIVGGGDVGSVDDANVNITSTLGDLSGLANQKLANEMFEYKHITFSQIQQFVIEDEITTAKAKVNTNTVLKQFQKYTIQLPTFVSANNIELSLDDGTTHLALVDESLVAIIGTDGADAKMEVFWNGASLVKFVSQELASKTSTSITENFELLSGTWALVSGGDFDGLYEYDISDAGVTANDIAEVWAKQSTITLFNDAQFSPENDTTAGILTVYCTVLPTVSIFINYTITKGVV